MKKKFQRLTVHPGTSVMSTKFAEVTRAVQRQTAEAAERAGHRHAEGISWGNSIHRLCVVLDEVRKS